MREELSRRGQRGPCGFTLVELLIVVAVIAVLSVVVLLVMNPAELLKQSRDARRLSELQTLSTALAAFEADQHSASLGSASTTYVSIPDTSATCASLGLPSLPSGWSYHCVTESALRKINGTGWIPVDLTQLSTGAPISALPIDPINSTSTGLYFTYTPGGSFKLTAKVEAQRNAAKTISDGGLDPTAYETGTDLDLPSFAGGLAAYWDFEDANATATRDKSGSGNTATWSGSSPSHYQAGKVGTYAAYFGGNGDFLTTALTSGAAAGRFGTGDFTIAFWVKGNGVTGAYPNYIHGAQHCGCSHDSWEFSADGSIRLRSTAIGGGSTSNYNMAGNVWRFIAGGRANGELFFYVDGALVGTAAHTATLSGGDRIYMGTARQNGGPYVSGVAMDDVRIYSRALSSDEIRAIYSAQR